MEKLVLSMNIQEFNDAMRFMYEVYTKNKDINVEIHDMTPQHIAYMSYYNIKYNNVFATLVKSERIITENIIIFINALCTKNYSSSKLSLSKILDIAYYAIHNKTTLKYFTSDSFPTITALDNEGIPTMINDDIIPSILAIVSPKIH